MYKILFCVLIGFIPNTVWCAPKIPKASTMTIAAPDVLATPTVAPEWYCQTICAGGCGGRPHYDIKKQICRCRITEHIDDGDMELIQKTAKIIGMKIKFYGNKSKNNKRSLTESEVEEKEEIEPKVEPETKDEDAESTEIPKLEETTLKVVPKPLFPKKVVLGAFKPLNRPSFLTDLTSRHGENIPQDHADAILGQIDHPRIIETEPHHNIHTGQEPGAVRSIFGNAMLGQIEPLIDISEPHRNIHAGPALGGGFGAGFAPRLAPGFHVPAPPQPQQSYPPHLTPALTRSLLMNVREKLDNLMMRTQQYPYQPSVMSHETESMSNTLKQITQVNVNVRPVGTTFGYFFNNLVNQLAPMLRAEGPGDAVTEGLDGLVTDKISKDEESKDKHQKGVKNSKNGKNGKVAVELGKKHKDKSTTMKISEEVIEESSEEGENKKNVKEFDESNEEGTSTVLPTPSTVSTINKIEDLIVTSPDNEDSTTKQDKIVLDEGKKMDHKDFVVPTLLPLQNMFTTPKTTLEDMKLTTKDIEEPFLPIQDGDDVVGDAADYLYDDTDNDDIAEI